MINTKYFRMNFWLNNSTLYQGFIGIYYDSYRIVDGPETFNIGLYFFGVDIEIGQIYGIKKNK